MSSASCRSSTLVCTPQLSPTIGCSPDPRRAGVEVDVMERFTPEANEVRHNNHWSGYGEDHQRA